MLAIFAMLGSTIAQNACFTLVSRARNGSDHVMLRRGR